MDLPPQSATTPPGPPPSARPAFRRRGLLVLQIAVAALLLVTLVPFVDWRSLLARVAAIEPCSLAAAVIALVAVLLVGAFDLWVLLRALAPISYSTMLRIYVIGWSSFLALPGSAGDAVQILFFGGRRRVPAGHRRLLDRQAHHLRVQRRARPGRKLALPARSDLAGPDRSPGTRRGRPRSGRLALFRPPRHRLVECVLSVIAFATGYARRYPGRIAANAAVTVAKLVLSALPYWIVLRGLGVAVCSPVVLLSPTPRSLRLRARGVQRSGHLRVVRVAVYVSQVVPSYSVLCLYLVIRTLVLALAFLSLALSAARRQPL